MTRTNINELATHRFIGTPKLLLYGETYQHLSGNAFKTYVALYDRFTLSVKNNWLDENNDVYFVFDLKELENLTKLGKKALTNARKQLKDVGLLEEVYTGRNNRLYLSLPEPKNEEEAKFIITDEIELKDTSQMTEEEKNKIAENLKSNTNSKKTDESAKGTIAVGTAQQQHSSNDKKQTKVRKELSDSAKGTTNDTELNEPNKELKDNKESAYELQNSQLEISLQENKITETENSLIEDYINEYSLSQLFGERVIKNMKIYSFSDFQTFKVFTDKLLYSLQSVEKERKKTYLTIHSEQLHDELAKTFNKVIRQHKQGKVQKLNDYLFVSFKQVFNDFAEYTDKPKNNIEKVPMINWLNETTN